MKPTKQTIDLYSIIGWLAMIAVPIAPMIYFGWRVYSSVLDETNHEGLAIVAAAVTAVGLEITGVLAGHRAMAFWRLGDIRRTVLAGFILLAYILIGVHELSNNFTEITIGATVFVIAPLVYLLVALGEVLEHEEATQTAVSGFDLEQAKADRALERELKRKQLELDANARVQIELAHEQNQASIAIAQAKAQASIANAEARKAKVVAEQSQREVEQEQKEEAQKQYECEDCGKLFGTVQALNAHGRFCNSIVKEPSKNGTIKETS